MHSSYVQSLSSDQIIPFTAGDLVEGLGFLDPTQRRALLFALEQELTASEVVELTHADLATLSLSVIAKSVIEHTPRHIRLRSVFWMELEDGLIAPLLGLEREVQAAFGGMSWSDLQSAYLRMIWVDPAVEAEHFAMTIIDELRKQ